MKTVKSKFTIQQSGMMSIKRDRNSLWFLKPYDRTVYEQNNRRLSEFQFKNGDITDFDVNESYLIACTKKGQVVLWDKTQRYPILVTSLPENFWLKSIVFLQSDMIAASSVIDCVTLIFSLKTGKVLQKLEYQHNCLEDALNENLLVFDTQNGITFYDWHTDQFDNLALEVDVVFPVFSPDGQFVAGFGEDGILIFRRSDMMIVNRLRHLKFDIKYMTFLSGKYMLTSIPDNFSVQIWNIETGEIIYEEQQISKVLRSAQVDKATNEVTVNFYNEITQQTTVEIWDTNFLLND